jgi:hypothetical protein
VRWEFRTFGEIQEGAIFNVYSTRQDNSVPPVTPVPSAEAWIVTNGERIRANVLKADQSHILLASDKLQTLHLLPASNNHRHFGRVGPSLYSEDWQEEQILPPAR